MKKTGSRYDKYEIPPEDREALSKIVCPGTKKTLMGIDVEDHPSVLSQPCNTLLPLGYVADFVDNPPDIGFGGFCEKCGNLWSIPFDILKQARKALERLHKQGYED